MACHHAEVDDCNCSDMTIDYWREGSREGGHTGQVERLPSYYRLRLLGGVQRLASSPIQGTNVSVNCCMTTIALFYIYYESYM